MTRRRRGLRPIKFTLRFYPGQDDDLIHWLDELNEEQIGAKTQAMKDALRRGMRTDSLQATALAPALDLVEVRQVVEAAVASALGRFEGNVVGATATTPAEEDDEVEDLLEGLQYTLVLGED
jgi:hypothetical protein